MYFVVLLPATTCCRSLSSRGDLVYALRCPNPSVRCFCEALTWSNSSRSTSPSPFRSNILKAISKFLWGAGHKHTQKKTDTTNQCNTISKHTAWCWNIWFVSHSFKFCFDLTAACLQNGLHPITNPAHVLHKWFIFKCLPFQKESHVMCTSTAQPIATAQRKANRKTHWGEKALGEQ